jgi:hypothetical protein
MNDYQISRLVRCWNSHDGISLGDVLGKRAAEADLRFLTSQGMIETRLRGLRRPASVVKTSTWGRDSQTATLKPEYVGLCKINIGKLSTVDATETYMRTNIGLIMPWILATRTTRSNTERSFMYLIQRKLQIYPVTPQTMESGLRTITATSTLNM